MKTTIALLLALALSGCYEPSPRTVSAEKDITLPDGTVAKVYVAKGGGERDHYIYVVEGAKVSTENHTHTQRTGKHSKTVDNSNVTIERP